MAAEAFIETNYDGIAVSRPFYTSMGRVGVTATASLKSLPMYETGDRRNLFLKFLSVKFTRQGYSVFKFVDEGNNLFISFSDDIKHGDDPLEVDCCYIVKATIKRHSHNDYENHDENHINRLRVLNKIGIKKENE